MHNIIYSVLSQLFFLFLHSRVCIFIVSLLEYFSRRKVRKTFYELVTNVLLTNFRTKMHCSGNLQADPETPRGRQTFAGGGHLLWRSPTKVPTTTPLRRLYINDIMQSFTFTDSPAAVLQSIRTSYTRGTHLCTQTRLIFFLREPHHILISHEDDSDLSTFVSLFLSFRKEKKRKKVQKLYLKLYIT